MFRREIIRYGNPWVRLVCCLWVAVAVANAVHFRALAAWEDVARDLVFGGSPYVPIPAGTEILVVVIVCAVISVFRIERPWNMVGCGIIVGGAYAEAVLLTAANADIMLPIVSPLLALVGASGVLQTMAWSEERACRHALEQLERAKQQFTDMLVHDLRRRISSMLVSLSLVEDRVDEADQTTRELTDTMRATGERVLLEINDLLDIRKIEEGEMRLRPEPALVADMVRACIAEYRAALDLLQVSVEIEGSTDLTIRLDANVFSRVLANLLWNAAQNAPEHTAIHFAYRVDEATGGCCLSVANRGRVIPGPQQARLFDAFVSNPGEGQVGGDSTGLGLAFCRLAVEAHGGTIELASPWPTTGDGVCVTVRLPASCVMRP